MSLEQASPLGVVVGSRSSNAASVATRPGWNPDPSEMEKPPLSWSLYNQFDFDAGS